MNTQSTNNQNRSAASITPSFDLTFCCAACAPCYSQPTGSSPRWNPSPSLARPPREAIASLRRSPPTSGAGTIPTASSWRALERKSSVCVANAIHRAPAWCSSNCWWSSAGTWFDPAPPILGLAFLKTPLPLRRRKPPPMGLAPISETRWDRTRLPDCPVCGATSSPSSGACCLWSAGV